MALRFAGYPAPVVYANPDGTTPVQQLLWGDWLSLESGRSGPYRQVRARGEDGWMHEDDIQAERLLEVTFVDIGQGDGCHVVTPDDKHFVIDAGERDNMVRYLKWRYGGFRRPWTFEAAIITHPDSDHYLGFAPLFKLPVVRFKTIYHNGFMERNGPDRLGPKIRDGRRSYYTDLVRDRPALERFLSDPDVWARKQYPSMLADALANDRADDVRMLSSEDLFLPGYGPASSLQMRVLGPVTEPDANGAPRLRRLGNTGETKNGHSVVLRADYGRVRIFLGGDLNRQSESWLLEHITGHNPHPRSDAARAALIAAARPTLEVDIAKSCHHGSHHFEPLFLEALNPLATVISSGDDEPHGHPRADALGAAGRYGRGPFPLVFSTELARSTKEAIKHPNVLRAREAELRRQFETVPEGTPEGRAIRERIVREFRDVVAALDRSVAVYGAINVRTDGQRIVVAQKLERPRSKRAKWDVYRIEPDATGQLAYVRSH